MSERISGERKSSAALGLVVVILALVLPFVVFAFGILAPTGMQSNGDASLDRAARVVSADMPASRVDSVRGSNGDPALVGRDARPDAKSFSSGGPSRPYGRGFSLAGGRPRSSSFELFSGAPIHSSAPLDEPIVLVAVRARSGPRAPPENMLVSASFC